MRLFHRVGRFTSNLMSGAVGSTAWIPPSTLQNSPLELPASVSVTNVADTMVAPLVGRPIAAAGIFRSFSATQRCRAPRVVDVPCAAVVPIQKPAVAKYRTTTATVRLMLFSGSLFPRRVDRRTDEQRLVRIRPRTELLQAAVAHLRDVEIALLIHARTMHVEEAARVIAERAPGVEEMTLEVVLDDLCGGVLERPDA